LLGTHRADRSLTVAALTGLRNRGAKLRATSYSEIVTLRLAAAIVSALAAARAADLTPEQSRFIDQTRVAALNYSKWLPNLICNERIRRESDWGTGKMVRGDDLTVQVSYVNQKESYRVIARGRSKADQRLENIPGAVTQGEFGSMLRWIFEPDAQAAFEWQGESTVRDQAVVVVAYSVSAGKSRMALQAYTVAAFVAFHGTLSIDPETHLVLSLTASAEGPEGFAVRKSDVQLDYAWKPIAGHDYLVPLRAEIAMTELLATNPMQLAPGGHIYSNESCIGCQARERPKPVRITTQYLNHLEFSDYREFTANSKVTFK